MEIHRQRRRLDDDERRPGARLRLPAGRNADRTTSTAASGPATTCSPRASSASTPRPASASGTSRSCITASGTMTRRPRRSSTTSRWTAGASRPSRSSRKQGMTFVFDRVTGKPVWPIEERPVPHVRRARRATRRRRSPSRRSPRRTSSSAIDEDDLIDFTPELRAEALRDREAATCKGRCTRRPRVSSKAARRARGCNPGYGGGANWNGGAFDPETNMMYVPTRNQPMVAALTQRRSASSRTATTCAPRPPTCPGPQRPADRQAALEPRSPRPT